MFDARKNKVFRLARNQPIKNAFNQPKDSGYAFSLVTYNARISGGLRLAILSEARAEPTFRPSNA